MLSGERRLLQNRWLWVGGVIAFLIFLPNLIWNIQHHFPFLELQANIRASGRDVPLGPVAFFRQEILLMDPLTLPIWLAGLWFYFFTEAGKRFRAIGWAWIFTAVVIVTMSPRVYYLFPAFPVLFAGGGVLWEQVLARPRLAWFKVAYPVLMLLTGAVLAPLAIPLLPPETYIRYTKAIGLQQPAIETHELGPLPQIFADQFGWEEMAATVARVYNSLPPEIRARTAIFAQNYGQAGAIDLFGPKYGLPPAISGHQSYFLWGPRGYTGESMIVMDDRQEDSGAAVHPRAKSGQRVSSILDALRAFRCVLLPGNAPAAWRVLASREDGGIERCSETDFSARSPRMGSLYISSWEVLMIMKIQADENDGLHQSREKPGGMGGPQNANPNIGLRTQSTKSHATNR